MAKVALGSAREIRANWSKNVEFAPTQVVHPRSEREIVHHIARATAHGIGIRAIGAGHSFSAIAKPEGALLTLDHYRGLVHLDSDTGEVTLRAGTRLWEIGPMLARHDRALEVMGDVDRQSIAGAISTGTHGTGGRFTGVSGLVTGLKIMLANGDCVWADRDHNVKLFEAARLGLGALGIIVEVKLRTIPLYKLHRREYSAPLDETVATFLETSMVQDHQEFFFVPGGERAIVRELNHVPAQSANRGMGRVRTYLDSEVVGNGAFALANRLVQAVPSTKGPLSRAVSSLMPAAEAVGLPHRLYVASRRTRFRECELAVPASRFEEAFEALTRALEGKTRSLIFPLEVRRAAADDVWLSTAHGRDTVYIAAHNPVHATSDDYLHLVHDTLVEFEGRPHWGKMHWLREAELRELYPNFEQFVSVRNELDPDRLFSTPYLDSLLGG
ncbi:D-arabinono-1,4-lactone oxidase [Dermabacter jinjuensis]|uniref:FAD-linked oxidoreductase n=1 Tax=Dermabacter jinjuensis TaxID=1667168 RepID=A0ABN5DY27_9MICO|nr:D-arabinono-1,4-lactone oxidase [Dermabacter jinjuensis]ATH96769.1 FAD-linked oxidoreductase [Dermabacter jinjuensis]UEB90878.1 FAD-binding protein [Dermabacter jinjuensis]